MFNVGCRKQVNVTQFTNKEMLLYSFINYVQLILMPKVLTEGRHYCA